MIEQTQQRVRLNVKGKVQGVFYRQSTKERATALSLSGWVRNEPDGSVLIEAQGEKDSLDALLAWCWQGPLQAEVSQVTRLWLEAEAESKTFRILY